MNITLKTKRIASIATALVITGGLVVGSAAAANAAYPDKTPVAVKVTQHTKKTTVKKKVVIAGNATAGAKVVVTYGPSAKKASKVLGSDIASKKGDFSVAKKITKKGTYTIKVTVSKKGFTTKVIYYVVTITKK